MHFQKPKNDMLELISSCSYKGPFPVEINFEPRDGNPGFTDTKYIYINPWDGLVFMEGQKFNMRIETDTVNPGNDIAWLWQ